MIIIKPHHFFDVIKLYGNGIETFMPDEKYKHSFYSVANKIIADKKLEVELTEDDDTICSTCVYLDNKICTDKIEPIEGVESKYKWNRILDDRMMKLFKLREGQVIKSGDFCRMIYSNRYKIFKVWDGDNKKNIDNRYECFCSGAEKYLSIPPEDRIKIHRITGCTDKQSIARNILEGLPDWFGIPESTEEYIRECSKMPFWAAYDAKEPVGFIAVKENTRYAAEIYVMGMAKRCHRHGGGRKLFDECRSWCIKNKYEFLQVKTLDCSNPDPFYADTRKFYKAMGFRPMECIPELWGKNNPCLIMIMKL